MAQGTQVIRVEGSSQGKGGQRGTEGEKQEKGTRLEAGDNEEEKKGHSRFSED